MHQEKSYSLEMVFHGNASANHPLSLWAQVTSPEGSLIESIDMRSGTEKAHTHVVIVRVPLCNRRGRCGYSMVGFGSTNAMRRNEQGLWEADNFDGTGFVLGMQRKGYELAGKRVLMAGGGGAGSSIAAALLQAGIDRLYLQEPDTAKVLDLLARLEQHWPGRCEVAQPQHLSAVDVVINATPLGLSDDDPLPIDIANLSAGTLVADIIMQPVETRLLREAHAAGHPVQPGSYMFNEQLGCYKTFFGL